jgi:hypothetical protein
MFPAMKTDNVALQLSVKCMAKRGHSASENSNFDVFQAKPQDSILKAS